MTTYGIDLGTTYSCIAYVDDTGRPVVAKSADGYDTTPSVVYFEAPRSVVVGRAAKNSAMLNPELVAELVKRHMGRDDVRYEFHGETHTPESISALILRELARAAEEETGEPVEDVVITVPAYFGVLERDATRKAGQIAGLNVLDVLAEPVAAALHYQTLNDDAGQRHILVYDLGGGTFDTTVIRLDGADVQVVCTDGDHQLGGADWDAKIIEFLLRGFTDQNPQLDPGGDEHFMQDLAGAAERLKQELSATKSRRHNMRFDGAVAQLELTREQLEELTSELLDRTMEITERTLATAREKGVTRFDDVLLVGGMTRMPAVAQALKDRFGLEARQHEPDLAVAKGAALFALVRRVKVSLPGEDGDTTSPEAVQEVADQLGLSVQQVEDMAAKRVATVVPRAFGLKTTDATDPVFKTDPDRAREYVSHLLTANTALPADTGPQLFYTIADNQRAVKLEVWEQAGSVPSEELAHNTCIGHGMLSELPPRPAGSPFEVTFHMTETGLLQVHGREAGSGREVRFEIQIGGMDDAQVREATTAVAQYAVSG
jgi:molecular chaperone DnaK